jgi:hypothetical protein
MDIMSIFSAPIVVSVWMFALPIILFMVAGAYLVYYYWDNQKYCPELPVLKGARKRNLPALTIHNHNGFYRLFLGEKEKRGSIIFKFDKNTKEGLRVDPGIQGGSVPKSFTSGGLVMYHYGTSSGFASDPKTAIAQQTILKYVREKYPILEVFDGQTILEYCQRPRQYLTHDCRNLAELVDINITIPDGDLSKLKEQVEQQITREIVVSGQEVDDNKKNEIIDSEYKAAIKQYTINYRGNELAKIFMQIQDETAKLPLPSGIFFSFAEAFLNTASALTAFDLQTLMHLFEQIAEKGKGEQLKWLLGVAFAFAIVICGFAFAYVLVGAAGK